MGEGAREGGWTLIIVMETFIDFEAMRRNDMSASDVASTGGENRYDDRPTARETNETATNSDIVKYAPWTV
ncbi:hypothetical protein RRG08_015345 [Elysia crispata]|uniref:Uncharacterized protein n=1 Tax=Elysia crispata TaxID=231223 RepID=A0AAE1A826_9GAST|nr:hypothetical protein RRG08_015345 [Elysia crispata]